jgi:RNA polymerase sigma factor (sigma-70 family)
MTAQFDPALAPFPVLYERMRAGDDLAWSEFHARYAPLLRQMARRWLNPRLRLQADSVDMAQSVLRVLLQSDGRVAFETEARFRGWLATVTRNRVVRLARRADGPGGRTLGRLAQGEDVVEPEPGPSELAEKAEAIHRLKSAMDLLTAEERELVCLREFEELAFGDVARRTGRPSADAARKAFDRALKRLERLLRTPEAPGGRSRA